MPAQPALVAHLAQFPRRTKVLAAKIEAIVGDATSSACVIERAHALAATRAGKACFDRARRQFGFGLSFRDDPVTIGRDPGDQRQTALEPRDRAIAASAARRDAAQFTIRATRKFGDGESTATARDRHLSSAQDPETRPL